jgi:hypothetical protein
MSKSAATTVATGVQRRAGINKRFITDISWGEFCCYHRSLVAAVKMLRRMSRQQRPTAFTSLALFSLTAVKQGQQKGNRFAVDVIVGSIFCKWRVT